MTGSPEADDASRSIRPSANRRLVQRGPGRDVSTKPVEMIGDGKDKKRYHTTVPLLVNFRVTDPLTLSSFSGRFIPVGV